MKIINISGVIGWDVTAQDVRDALPTNGEQVEVQISSPGGLISTGLEIFNLLRDYNGPIDCVLKGYAMSMGSYIPLAIPLNRFAPGKIKAEDNAIYMVHNARGWTGGDHNEILGYGEALKGMSTMIAKAYAKRTGKCLEDVQAMMDKTTYLYGDQIKEHGFADEILCCPDGETDSESAMATARACFDGMVARMVADEAKMKADMQAVARMLASTPSTPAESVNSVVPPAAAGINNKEVQQMSVLTLAALLAANPAAKVEHDALVASARAEGDTAGAKRVEDRINAAAPFLANESYGAAVGAVALKVIKGEEAAATLTTIVTVLDAQKEQAKGTAAAGATGATPETPAAPAPAVNPTAVVTDDAGLSNAVALFKGGK